MRVRRGVDNAPMYALKVARGGLRIKPLAASDCMSASGGVASVPPQTPAGTEVPCGTFKVSRNGTLRVWDAVPATLKTLANLFDLDRLLIVSQSAPKFARLPHTWDGTFGSGMAGDPKAGTLVTNATMEPCLVGDIRESAAKWRKTDRKTPVAK